MQDIPRILIEVCIESPADATIAEQGGADRLELCASLHREGLTPTLDTFLEVRARTQLPIFVMIRPRAGEFVFNDFEIEEMAQEIMAFRRFKPDGFVLGLLDHTQQIDVQKTAKLLEHTQGYPCVFHRAFDCCPDPFRALEQLIELGFQRVLTSGGRETALQGAEQIAKFIERARDRIEVLPCGKIRSVNVADLVRLTKCQQVHGSFRARTSIQTKSDVNRSCSRSPIDVQELLKTRELLDKQITAQA